MARGRHTRGRDGGKRSPGNPNTHPLALRLRVVKEVLERGTPAADVSRLFGIGHGTIREWILRYRAGGIDELAPNPVRPPPGRKREALRDEVVAAKQEHPEHGTRRIRDVLARFSALGISETEVRRILHEEGLLETRTGAGARARPRRFERARPNQLWQSDIFTFLLRRHQRIYLTAFMDDHSRFIVSRRWRTISARSW